MSAVIERPPRLELAARARALHDAGVAQKHIAAELRISRSYASSLLSDPDGSKDRARKNRYCGTCARDAAARHAAETAAVRPRSTAPGARP